MTTTVNEMSKFDKLKNKIKRKEGYSEKGAAAAAYEAGVKKYGKAGMAKKAAAGRKHAHESVMFVNLTEGKAWDDLSPEAKDLILYADNNKELKKTSLMPILAALAKKKIRGEYDPEKACDDYGYHADRAAMGCTKDHGEPGDVWHKRYKKGTRYEAAKHWEAFHRDNLENHHNNLHESVLEDESTMDIEVKDENRQPYYELVKSVVENKPVEFKDKFAEILQPKLVDQIEAAKAEIKQFMFDFTNGKNVMGGDTFKESEETVVNELSSQLLGRYAKKTFDRAAASHMHDPYLKRRAGHNLAIDKLVGKARVPSNAIHASIHPDDCTGMDD